MEETISTPVETTEQTPLETTAESQPVEQTPESVEQEPVEVAEAAENVEAEETAKEEPKEVIDWEKRAKDQQANFTRVSQELAELKKQIEGNKPKMVQEGKINPEFEQQYKFDVDNREFLAYDNLARQLEPESRAEVEKLMREAQRLYNPSNSTAYEAKMAQVKDYFRSDLVEGIAKEKMQLMSQVKAKFDQEILADKQERAQKVSQAIEAVPELRELVYQDSENFSPEVLDIVKTMFDYTGDVDIESTQKAISKIKELGVKEYLAKQKAEEERAKASVPTGSTVVQNQDNSLTAEMVSKDYNKYLNEYMGKGLSLKEAMGKLDAIIMKG